MKIVIIFPATSRIDGFGGMHRFVSVLSKYLYENGDDVTIVFLNERFYYPCSGRVIELGSCVARTKCGKLIRSIYRWIKLYQILKGTNFDLICNFFWLTPLLSVRYRKKMISAIHSNPFSFSMEWRFIAKNIFPLSRLIIVPSKFVEMQMRNSWKINNVVSISNPLDFDYIDTQMIKEPELPCSGVFILTVGRLSPEKNFGLLIEAYSLSQLKSEVGLVILGDGEQMVSLRSVIKSKNLESKVFLLGVQSNPFMYMRRSCFFVSSSITECFPMALIEALACGVPVISTDWPGADGIVKCGKNGLLAKNNDVFELSKTMDRLYFDIKLREHCKMNARESVVHCAVEKIMQSYREVFLSVACSSNLEI